MLKWKLKSIQIPALNLECTYFRLFCSKAVADSLIIIATIKLLRYWKTCEDNTQIIKTLTDVSAGSFQGTGAGSHLSWSGGNIQAWHVERQPECVWHGRTAKSHTDWQKWPLCSQLSLCPVGQQMCPSQMLLWIGWKRILCEIHHSDKSWMWQGPCDWLSHVTWLSYVKCTWICPTFWCKQTSSLSYRFMHLADDFHPKLLTMHLYGLHT